MEKLCKPVIETLKSIAEDQKIVTKAIEYNSQVNPVTKQSETSSLQIENVYYDIFKYGILSAHYLKTPVIKYDHAFEIKPIHDNSGHTFKIGREEVTYEGIVLFIDDKRYYGAVGLWKLLTLKDPGNVPSDNLEVY